MPGTHATLFLYIFKVNGINLFVYVIFCTLWLVHETVLEIVEARESPQIEAKPSSPPLSASNASHLILLFLSLLKLSPNHPPLISVEPVTSTSHHNSICNLHLSHHLSSLRNGHHSRRSLPQEAPGQQQQQTRSLPRYLLGPLWPHRFHTVPHCRGLQV